MNRWAGTMRNRWMDGTVPQDELTSPPSFLISNRSHSLPDLLASWTSLKITDSCKTVILDMTRQSFTCHLGLAGLWSRHCFWWRECTSACCMRFGVSLCYLHAQMDCLHATVICYNGAVLDNHCMLYSSIRVYVFWTVISFFFLHIFKLNLMIAYLYFQAFLKCFCLI